jgi:hypothetical protein
MNLRMLFVFVIGGLAVFGAYGLANTLTTSGYNEIQTIRVVSSHPENLDSLDLGTTTTISQVDLDFSGTVQFWNGRTVTVDIYDINDTLIGTGSVTANNDRPKVTLSNTITAAERPDLRRVVVTS